MRRSWVALAAKAEALGAKAVAVGDLAVVVGDWAAAVVDLVVVVADSVAVAAVSLAFPTISPQRQQQPRQALPRKFSPLATPNRALLPKSSLRKALKQLPSMP